MLTLCLFCLFCLFVVVVVVVVAAAVVVVGVVPLKMLVMDASGYVEEVGGGRGVPIITDVVGVI